MDHSWIGRVVDDRYEIQGVLGRGGMGTVFRARHRLTAMQVALKVLHDVTIDDPAGVQRFIDEARAPATIGHPAIVEVTDANRAPTGELYIAMQLLFGRSLRGALGTLGGEDVRRVGLELLDALAAAHRRNFVHRDLKPENLFLVAGGALKLLDFGIAKVLGRDGRTRKGQMLGTLEYMAPEQLHDPSGVDARADLWAVGVILYEAIAGVRPFGGTTFDEKYHALATDLPVPIDHVANVTPDVAAFFARALARDRTQRFGSAEEMAAALRTLQLVPAAGTAAAAGGPTLATGDRWDAPAHSPSQQLAHAPTRRAGSHVPWALLAIGGGVVAIAVTIGVVVGSRGGAPATPATPATATDMTKPVADCVAACEKFVSCKLSIDAETCLARCKHDRLAMECAREQSCEAIATCQLGKRCGARVDGALTCAQERQCEIDCGKPGVADPVTCLCACKVQTRPSSALLLARWDFCGEEISGTDPAQVQDGYAKYCALHVAACNGDRQ